MNKSEIISGFNNHLCELVESLIEILPEHSDLRITAASLLSIRKFNPKLPILTWKSYVQDKYEENIMAGNIVFFLEKDYAEDITDSNESINILNKIIIIKNTIKKLDKGNLDKTILYLQNLTKLCKIYFS
jgi:hypothetical protein